MSKHILLVLILTIAIFFPSTIVMATSEQTYSGNSDDNEGWIDSCYDSGFRAGQDWPFSQPTYDHCGDEAGGDDAYYDGFINGCMSVEGNTRDVCESATDAWNVLNEGKLGAQEGGKPQ